MLIKPNYNCAIVVMFEGFDVRFAEIPDLDVVSEIYELESNKGIEVLAPAKIGFAGDVSLSSVSKPDKQRLDYYVTVSPVFEIMQIANLLACELKDKHGMVVKVIDDRRPDSGFKTVSVLR